ncbi:thioesterase II family protein [Candidatus Magnetomonas plexicatena]|uniref:thioesterase II family protein n=1 Tax=Candidatus Magnetomonas plexicatena TaxID=2552947 RepID=UPI001104D219|nr:thioesterase [Nitrospirales bacterium LBB_01]
MITLFCIPFAGGSSYSYRDFQAHLGDFIEIAPLELQGRGRKYGTPLQTNIHDMADGLYNQMQEKINGRYAFWGHSMGGWLAYLLVKKLTQEHKQLPEHLFITGCEAPSVENRRRDRHKLQKNEFMELLKKYDGCPAEVLQNDELMELFEPIIRADFKAVETYEYEPPATLLNTPITVMRGLKEEISYRDVLMWQDETVHKIKLLQFPGSHFFIYEHILEIGRIITDSLTL